MLWAVFKGWDRYQEIKALSMEVVPIESLIRTTEASEQEGGGGGGGSGEGAMRECTAKEGRRGCVHRKGCCVPWAASLPME